jgi:diguanylate cyclase (GGDEF)-like protein/PAS domain S-box-containing protein
MFESHDLSGILDSMDLGVLILDRYKRVLYWNPWLEERSHYSRSAVESLSFAELFPELTGSRIEESIDQALMDGYPSVISNVFNRSPFPLFPKGKVNVPDQSRIQQSVNVSRYASKQGADEHIYCLIQITDVTAAVMREQALEQQVKERRLVEKTLDQERSLFVTGPSIVFKCRAEDRLPVEYISPNVSTQLGYEPEVFTTGQLNFLDLIHPDDLQRITEEIAESSLTGNARFEQEYRLKDHSGAYRWFHEVMVVNRNRKGKISHFHGYMQDITERKHAEAHVKHLAYYDALTELPNRRFFMDLLEQEVSRCHRHHTFGAVLFLDLNRFKAINDSLGHSVGDGLLKGVAERISESLRSEDTVARIGGDEFLVLLTQLGEREEQAVVAASHVLGKITTVLTEPFFVMEHEIQIGPSIGVCLFANGKEEAPDIIRHADIAMYQAKHNSRSCYCFYENSMQELADQRLALEKDLIQGLRYNEFELYYQPQMDQSGVMYAAECLIRWKHPARGFVSPAEFIPVAEEVGLIIPIGDWVMREACLTLKRLMEEGQHTLDYLAVNVSPTQFHHSDFIVKVQKIIRQTGVDTRRLVFEITEGLLIQDINEAVIKIKQLRKMGIRFAIDDFGTGYSSLAYLHRLPLDILKIDQSFVRDLNPEDSNTAIIKNIISMAHHLELDLIAEGVETEDTMRYLQTLGCGKFQGYYFHRPMPFDDFYRTLNADQLAAPTPIETLR